MKKRIIGLILCLLIISTISYSPHASALTCAPLNIERLMENEKVFDGVIVAQRLRRHPMTTAYFM